VPAPGGEAGGQVTYSGASGVAEFSGAAGNYIATLTGAPGVSPILADNVLTRTASAAGNPDDVPAGAIVRTQA